MADLNVLTSKLSGLRATIHSKASGATSRNYKNVLQDILNEFNVIEQDCKNSIVCYGGDDQCINASAIISHDTTLCEDDEDIPDEDWLADTPFLKLAEARSSKEAEIGMFAFKNTMLYLDEILMSAKKEFTSVEIDRLPKTPAASRRKARKVVIARRRSSVAPRPSTIERPIRRTRRAAALKAEKQISTSVSETPKEKRSTRASTRASTRKAPSSRKVTYKSTTSTPNLSRAVASSIKDKVEAYEKMTNSPQTVKPKMDRAISKVVKALTASCSTPTLSSPAVLADGEDKTPTAISTSPLIMSSTSKPSTVKAARALRIIKTATPTGEAQSPSDLVDTIKKKPVTEKLCDNITEKEASVSPERPSGSGNKNPGDMQPTPPETGSRKTRSSTKSQTTEQSPSDEQSSAEKRETRALVETGSPANGNQSYVSASSDLSTTGEEVFLSPTGNALLCASNEKEKKLGPPEADDKPTVDCDSALDLSDNGIPAKSAPGSEMKSDSSATVPPSNELKRHATPEATNDTQPKNSKFSVEDQAEASPTAKEAVVVAAAPPTPSPELPTTRMTRSKMRKAAPPLSTSEDVDKPKNAPKQHPQPSPSRVKPPPPPPRINSPARAKSPARTQPSSTLTGNKSSAAKRKQQCDQDVGAKKLRTSSDSTGRSTTVKTLTKASSHSRLMTGSSTNSKSTANRLATASSTPDITRTTSFVRNLGKPATGRTSPQGTPSFARTVASFIKRATPKKVLTKEEQLEIKNKKLREKQEAEARRLEEAEKDRLQKLEAKKQDRIDKMNRVKETRQARLKEMEVKQKAIEKKNQLKTDNGTQALHRKQQEERERACLRDQKIHEAEERRKREEEARQQKLRQQEAEQKRLAEMHIRKKELDEAERQKKMASSLTDQQKLLKKIQEASTAAGQVAAMTSTTTTTGTKKPSIYEKYNKPTISSDFQTTGISRPALSTLPPSEKSQLNSTFTKDIDEDEEPDFVDIVNVLEEDDEIDDKKFRSCVIPSWSRGAKFNAAAVTQHQKIKCGQLHAAQVFGHFRKNFPDLSQIFAIHKPRFFKRTSSANWASPPLKNPSSNKRGPLA